MVVYPNAINKFWDVNGTSDIRFLEVIIEKMHERYNINRNRIYVSGFSLGAMMTYHCMDHLGDKVAAFGPVSGVRFDNKAPKAPRHVPFIHTHGTGDDVFKWTGDLGHAAGGYPYIPDYVQKWATYQNLDKKTEIKPYPASKKNSIASMTVWSSDNDTIEVALLAIEGKGHWHSEDIASGVSTTQEIWKFCKRYTLGPEEPEPPMLQKAEPEDMSFDLPVSQRTFTLTFDKDADIAALEGKLEFEGKTISLDVAPGSANNVAVLEVPASQQIPEGDCKLKISNLKNPAGGRGVSLVFSYTYGITEVGDEVKTETLLAPDWASMQATVGEGIPVGWKRVNSNSDGSNDTKESGAPNTGGARLKYFSVGGDFSTGFYLSAREYQLCTLSYGLYDGYRLSMKPGKYELKFRSTYWSEGSYTNSASFGVNVTPLGSTKAVMAYDDLKPSGCVKERTDVAVENTMLHDYAFSVDQAGDYVLNFTMSQGWSSIILADVVLTTYPSAADIYKGGFLRMMKEARSIYDRTASASEADIKAKRQILKDCIDKYADLSSTAPSVYSAAMKELTEAMEPLRHFLSGIDLIPADGAVESIEYFSPRGMRLNAPQQGVNIVRTTYSNGAVEVKKVMK